MNKFTKIILIFILLVVLSSLYFNVRGDDLKIRSGKVLNISTLPDRIAHPDYQDDFVKIKLVKAEGKILAGVQVINPNVIVFYSHGSENYLDMPGFFFDEIEEKDLNVPRLYIYKKAGLFYKKAIRSLGFGEFTGIKEYPTLMQAREALKQ